MRSVIPCGQEGLRTRLELERGRVAAFKAKTPECCKLLSRMCYNLKWILLLFFFFFFPFPFNIHFFFGKMTAFVQCFWAEIRKRPSKVGENKWHHQFRACSLCLGDLAAQVYAPSRPQTLQESIHNRSSAVIGTSGFYHRRTNLKFWPHIYLSLDLEIIFKDSASLSINLPALVITNHQC